MTAETTLRIAADFPNVIGIKEASGNIGQIQEIIDRRREGFLVLSGDDGIAVDVMRRGGDGVISVAVNAFPRRFLACIDLARGAISMRPKRPSPRCTKSSKPSSPRETPPA